MNWQVTQTYLRDRGYDPGPVDGKYGKATLAALMAYGAGKTITKQMRDIASALITAMIGKDITTPLRQAHFLAQCSHESGGWYYMTELGGADYFKKYDGRVGLGNTQPGDGYRFRGRGIIQITGRANYSHYAKLLGLDLVDHPELASQPDVASAVAVAYWDEHGLNHNADKDDIESITRAINGGLTNLDDRQNTLCRLKRALGI